MKQFYHLSAKHIGIVLIAISALLFIVVLFSTFKLMEAAELECIGVCGANMQATCPHAANLPIQSYVGFTAVFVLAGMGVSMVFASKKYQEELTEQQRMLEKIVASLSGDEKTVAEVIKEAGGAIFQSEIIEKTGFSKAKVSRLLDRLEVKGLIERRRRGMTNLILMKLVSK